MVIKKTSHSQICSSLNKHILFTSRFVIDTYEIGLFCSAHAALVRACTANRIYAYSAEASLNGNVFAQPYQNDTGRIRQRSGISVE